MLAFRRKAFHAQGSILVAPRISALRQNMSNSSETDLDLDLHFLPAWAQKAADPNRYAKYAGETAPDDRRKEPWDRRPRSRDNRSGPQGRKPGGQGQRRPDDRRRSQAMQRREAPA